MTIIVRVPGIPQPQGSTTPGMRKNGTLYTRSANPALGGWRKTVTLFARRAAAGRHLDGPLRVTVNFYMPKPQRPKWDRPATKPDADKLLRALMDGLADAGLFPNDSRVVSIHADEWYASTEHPIGCEALVERA